MGNSREIARLSNVTLAQALVRLDSYGICNVIRPTGFGKSYMLARITMRKEEGQTRRYKYKKCLYLYPLTIIMNDVKKKYGPESKIKLCNTDFMSYTEMNNRRKDGTLRDIIKQYDIVMCDECHLCGGEGVRACFDEIKDLFGPDGIRLIGVTASPNRMDGYDVIEELFGGKTCGVEPLSQQDCYERQLLQKPYWIVGVYDALKFKESAVTALKERMEDKFEKKDENELVRNIDKIDGAEKVISEALDKWRPNENYYKFICFYVNKADLCSKHDMVKGWFETIFADTDMKINEYNIVSTSFDEDTALDSSDEASGRLRVAKLSELDALIERENTIDIINCIDMLNMGYHVDDITGIIMLRNTRSEIIQIQQVGRCQSITAEKPPLIFDFVNNFNTKKWFKSDREKNQEEFVPKFETARDCTDSIMRVTGTNGENVYMVGGYLASLKTIDRLSNKEENSKKMQMESIKFWYTEMKAPLYVIAIMNNTSIQMIEQLLRIEKIPVRYEDELRLTMTSAQMKVYNKLTDYESSDELVLRERK